MDGSQAAPRVSIGLPVYNGEPFLRQTLDSLLSQRFGDFELIISDNGSTDGTEAICREYARRDARIRYVRHDINRGPAWNLNHVFGLARGEYFKWAAADDVCADQFLARCVQVLDRDPSVVLCWPATTIIDANGRVLLHDEYRTNTHSPSPQHRFGALMCVNHRRHGAFEIFGLIRSAALRKTGLFPPCARGDSILLARLSLRGRFEQVPERLFLNRDHSGRSVRIPPNRLRRLSGWLGRLVSGGPVPPTEWWDASKKGCIVFPEWRLWREYLASVHRSPLPWRQRAGCYVQVLRFSLRQWPKLIRDLITAARVLLRRLGRRQQSAAATEPQPPDTSAQLRTVSRLPVADSNSQ